MATTTKSKVKELTKTFNVTSETPLEDMRAFRSELLKLMQAHPDYVSGSKPEHIKAQEITDDDIQRKTYGLNGALKAAKEAIKAAKKPEHSPLHWVVEPHDESKSQYEWAMGSVQKLKPFMNAKQAKQTEFKPSEIIKALATAARLSPAAFAKRQALYLTK